MNKKKREILEKFIEKHPELKNTDMGPYKSDFSEIIEYSNNIKKEYKKEYILNESNNNTTKV